MENAFITGLLRYSMFAEFVKIHKNILLSFNFEKIHVWENNIDVTMQTIENDQCAHGYPNKLLQKEELKNLPFWCFSLSNQVSVYSSLIEFFWRDGITLKTFFLILFIPLVWSSFWVVLGCSDSFQLVLTC